MGNRRLSRKRLFQVEKAGQNIDLESGTGIKDAIVSASQHRQGQEIITEIAVDLGTSKAVLRTAGGGGDGDRSPIGVDSTSDATLLAFLTKLTTAKFGIITEIRAILVEEITSSGGSPPAVGIETGSTGDGRCIIADGSGTDGGTRVQIVQNLNVVGEDTTGAINDNTAADDFLYIVQEANDTADTLTGGKLLIYIHGFVAPDDL